MKPLLKYQIGLAVIGIFTLVLLVIIIPKAHANKLDNDTYNQASKIADKLNNYVNSQDKVPASLSAANISGVPATISYQKLSDDSYKFCVNYKTESTELNSSSFEGFGSGSDNDELSLGITHRAGQNCQTVKPGISSEDDFSSDDTDDPYAKCDSIQDDAAWQQCFDQVDNQSSAETD